MCWVSFKGLIWCNIYETVIIFVFRYLYYFLISLTFYLFILCESFTLIYIKYNIVICFLSIKYIFFLLTKYELFSHTSYNLDIFIFVWYKNNLNFRIKAWIFPRTYIFPTIFSIAIPSPCNLFPALQIWMGEKLSGEKFGDSINLVCSYFTQFSYFNNSDWLDAQV